MAAMAAAQTATITPPSSDHSEANGFQWDFATAPAKQDVSLSAPDPAKFNLTSSRLAQLAQG